MKIVQLEYFCTVSQYHSITQAAQKLYVTQPAISNAIKELEKEFSVRHLLQRMNVEIVCTTDDPADNLEFHRQIATTPFGVKVFPAWRPDKLMAVEDGLVYRLYLE